MARRTVTTAATEGRRRQRPQKADIGGYDERAEIHAAKEAAMKAMYDARPVEASPAKLGAKLTATSSFGPSDDFLTRLAAAEAVPPTPTRVPKLNLSARASPVAGF